MNERSSVLIEQGSLQIHLLTASRLSTCLRITPHAGEEPYFGCRLTISFPHKGRSQEIMANFSATNDEEIRSHFHSILEAAEAMKREGQEDFDRTYTQVCAAICQYGERLSRALGGEPLKSETTSELSSILD